MTQGQSGHVSTVAHGDRYLTAAASLVVGGAFFALWFWLLPQWLGFRVDTGGHSTLAIAGGASVGAGICGGPALRLGLRVDGTRHTCSGRSAAAIGGGGFLPLCAEPHVPGIRSGVDRVVGCVRPRQFSRRSRRRPPSRSACTVCRFLRRADSAQEIRGRLRRVLQECESMVAARPGVGQAIVAD